MIRIAKLASELKLPASVLTALLARRAITPINPAYAPGDLSIENAEATLLALDARELSAFMETPAGEARDGAIARFIGERVRGVSLDAILLHFRSLAPSRELLLVLLERRAVPVVDGRIAGDKFDADLLCELSQDLHTLKRFVGVPEGDKRHTDFLAFTPGETPQALVREIAVRELDHGFERDFVEKRATQIVVAVDLQIRNGRVPIRLLTAWAHTRLMREVIRIGNPAVTPGADRQPGPSRGAAPAPITRAYTPATERARGTARVLARGFLVWA